MAITSHIDQTRDLTIVKVTGVLSFDEAMPVIKDFYDGNPTKNVLWDLNAVTEIQITTEEVEAIASFGPRYQGKRKSGKTALVARKDVYYGLSRMFEIQSNIKGAPYQTTVFRNLEEAYQWLDESGAIL